MAVSYPLVHEGTGAVIAFTSGFTAEVVSIKRAPRKFEKLDVTKLSTTGQKEYIRSTLCEPGEIDIEVHYNPDVRYSESNVSDTFTITFPVISGSATNSADASSGFVVETQDVDIAIGKLMMSKLKVQLTGAVTHTSNT
jgi:hypothetical protein